MRALIFFVVLVSMMACGQVEQTGPHQDGGDSGPTSSGGEAGPHDAGGAGGDVGAAGRGAGGSAGGVFGAGGSAGGSAAGTNGDAGAAGPGPGAAAARSCSGTFKGASGADVCGQIAGTPAQPGGWQCEVGCSSSAADNAAGCVFYGVTYCVPACSWCRP